MKTIPLIFVLVALLVLGMFFYYFAPDSLKFWQSQTAAVGDSTGTSNEPSEPVHETITAKHQFKNGKHIIAGDVNMPTPCHILTTSAQVAESFPEQVTIQFVSRTSGEFCAQVITPARFKVEFTASENATVKATWNGQPVSLNLIPALPTDDLDNFELFIKG